MELLAGLFCGLLLGFFLTCWCIGVIGDAFSQLLKEWENLPSELKYKLLKFGEKKER